MIKYFTIPFFVLTVLAQAPIAPSPTAAGSVDGKDAGLYNVVNNFELGYRFRTVGGNVNQYRSSVNYGNGFRLLNGSMMMSSRNGRGKLFDQLNLTTIGLGNDPYQSAMFHVERNGLYRYDLNWRLNDYFNPGLVTDGGNSFHLTDTTYKMQDHNFTLFPQAKYKFFLGYTGSSQLGPAYTTEQGRPGIQLMDVQRRWNEYRIGNEIQVGTFRLNWMRGWENFKEDNGFTRSATGVPGYPAALTPGLLALTKADPYHGNSPYWRVALFHSVGNWFNWNGRFTYTSGRRDFILDETFLTVAGNATATTRVFNSGTAQRPVATANLNLVFTPVSKLTVLNSTAFYNARTQGDGSFTQFSPGAPVRVVAYSYLGIRTISNDTTANYQMSKLLGMFAGYHYSEREINSRETRNTPIATATQTNVLNAGNFGLRLRPWDALTVQLGAEIGRSDRPFTPVAAGNYHALNGRIQYRVKNFQVLAYTNTDYNNNSVSLSAYSSRSRRYAIDGSWTPRPWFSLDAGYSKMHLETVGGIAYVVAIAGAPPGAPGAVVNGDRSFYFSNLHTIYSGIRFVMKDRLEIYAGLTRVEDTGDGRAAAAGAGFGSARAVFQNVQTFPLTYTSPSGRVSLKINNRLRWNAGYQFYGYHQDFLRTSDLGYRANTGYTSLSVAF